MVSYFVFVQLLGSSRGIIAWLNGRFFLFLSFSLEHSNLTLSLPLFPLYQCILPPSHFMKVILHIKVDHIEVGQILDLLIQLSNSSSTTTPLLLLLQSFCSLQILAVNASTLFLFSSSGAVLALCFLTHILESIY